MNPESQEILKLRFAVQYISGAKEYATSQTPVSKHVVYSLEQAKKHYHQAECLYKRGFNRDADRLLQISLDFCDAVYGKFHEW